ncbi:MAG TPA: polysaccharide pyruvyl transferase family protein, partial [Candidatus Ozemobacteraceae bacterium]|nr:polysaccharide pyruvyl transferase family protein [Candidatus Ozemobacteraceae bacterium]
IIATAGSTPLPPGISAIQRRGISSWTAFIGALRNSRLVVGSGGLLQDWSFEGVTFYALRFFAARLVGKPAALFGAGIGPLRGRVARQLASAALSGVKTCMLRDAESVDLFGQLTGRHAQLGTDWSWALEPASAAINTSSRMPDDSVAINIRPWLTPEWQNAAQRWWPSMAGSKPIGVSARREDKRIMEQLFKGLPVYEPVDFPSLMADARRLREGWAMRYHVLLAMLRAGIPVRALPYDNKARQLAASAGIPVPSPSDAEPPKPQIAAPTFIAIEQERLAAMKLALRQAWEEST